MVELCINSLFDRKIAPPAPIWRYTSLKQFLSAYKIDETP